MDDDIRKHWHNVTQDELDVDAELEGVSEFGKGFIVCLAKWFEHFGNDQMRAITFIQECLKRPEAHQSLIMSDTPPPSFNYGSDVNYMFKYFREKEVPIYGSVTAALSHKIGMWFNGASDHLFDIIVPAGEKWDEIRGLVDTLQGQALGIGHGERMMAWDITYEELTDVIKLTKAIIVKVDKVLGLEPEWGAW